jgi:DnaJ-class molecular chaperone
MTCPECKGEKHHLALACPGARLLKMPCHVCQGSGEVSEEQAQWIIEGERMRKDRRNRGLTLRREAERRGMKPVELSDMEWGRVKPVASSNPRDTI